VAVVLGLLVAASYGAADFSGGLAAKRLPALTAVVLSQACGLPLMTVLALVGGGEMGARVLALGAASGVAGGIGLACLYRGLASGQMSVVAPITGVGAALVPLAWGLVQGERPSGAAFAGVAIAVVAVALISHSADDVIESATDAETVANLRLLLVLAVTAGVAFGLVFVLLAETGDDAGFWPLTSARAASIVLLGAMTIASGRSLSPRGSHAGAALAAAGVLDITANALFLLGARRGLLSIVAVLSSLYPAATVLLARIVLRERLVRTQLAGLALASTGIVLIAAG
jgi:drug/metabolite transporter (DMT)-like permease